MVDFSRTVALERLAAAAEELAAAARAVLAAIGGVQVTIAPASAPEAPWRSPTRDACAPEFDGEEGFARMFLSYAPSPELVLVGEGGFPPPLGAEEGLTLVPVAVAGDVALEIVHAGLRGDAARVDALIADGAAEVRRIGAEAGHDLVPAYLAAMAAFPELGARGAAWRS
jgi:hypothetical protein